MTPYQAQIKIKPCPMCGSKDSIIIIQNLSIHHRFMDRIPTVRVYSQIFTGYCGFCGFDMMEKGRPSESFDEAVEDWNAYAEKHSKKENGNNDT